MSAWSFADFHGSPQCRIRYCIWTKSLEEVPSGLARHLEQVDISCTGIGGVEGAVGVLNLAVFANCPLLEKIVVYVKLFEGWDRICVSGLASVPDACKSVAVTRDSLVDGDNELPLVRPEIGWQISATVGQDGKRVVNITRIPKYNAL